MFSFYILSFQGHTAAQVLSKWYSEYADTTDKELVSQYNSILRLLQGEIIGHSFSAEFRF